MACVAGALLAGAAPARADTGTVEQAGVSVAFSLADGRGRAGQAATAQLAVTDALTGRPWSGLRPLAWLLAWPQVRPPSEEECRDRIRTLLDTKLGWRADAEMNGHRLLMLQDDASVAVLNPLASLGGSRVERLIRLPAQGAALHLAAGGRRAAVTLPGGDAVAVLDPEGRAPPVIVSAGPGSRPGALADAGDGALWVALDGAGAVARLDALHGALGDRVPVGPGRQSLAAVPGGRAAVFTDEAPVVMFIGTDPGRPPVAVPLPAQPIAAEYGAAARELLVLLRDGSVLGLDPGQARPARPLGRRPGASGLRVLPDGRFALLLDAAGQVAVLDTADGTVTASAAVPGHPDQAIFTERFAYVRGAGSDAVAAFALDGLRQGRLEPVLIPVAAAPAQAALPGLPMLAPAPDGASAYVADAAGRGAAYYTEGMMAPAGLIAGTGAAPSGLLVQDRSFREAAPGRYDAPLLPRRAGRFIVPVLLDQPRFAHCFELEVAEGADAAGGRALDVHALFGGTALQAGLPARLAYAVRDADGRPVPGLRGVRLMAMDEAGQWQLRRMLPGNGGGIYSADVRFPGPGTYAVSISLGAHGGFGAVRATRVTVLPDGPDGMEAAR